jgi:hypothetical protein
MHPAELSGSVLGLQVLHRPVRNLVGGKYLELQR